MFYDIQIVAISMDVLSTNRLSFLFCNYLGGFVFSDFLNKKSEKTNAQPHRK